MGFCDSGQSQSNNYQWQDPLGPSGKGGTGAPALRSQIYSYLGGPNGVTAQSEAAGQNYATALKTAASNPGWQSAADNASKTAAGDYLAGSPQLDSAIANQSAQTRAAAANQDARIKNTYNNNGMTFSTGNQQAQEANNASANAQAANTAAQAYLSNYQAERQNQMNSGTALASATSTPLSYLSGIPSAYTSPLSGVSGLVSGLSSGGQVVNVGSNGTYSPSTGSDIMNGIGSL